MTFKELVKKLLGKEFDYYKFSLTSRKAKDNETNYRLSIKYKINDTDSMTYSKAIPNLQANIDSETMKILEGEMFNELLQ